jgi:hypothetical protein
MCISNDLKTFSDVIERELKAMGQFWEIKEESGNSLNISDERWRNNSQENVSLPKVNKYEYLDWTNVPLRTASERIAKFGPGFSKLLSNLEILPSPSPNLSQQRSFSQFHRRVKSKAELVPNNNDIIQTEEDEDNEFIEAISSSNIQPKPHNTSQDWNSTSLNFAANLKVKTSATSRAHLKGKVLK